MVDREFIITPVETQIVFRLQEAAVLENSLHLLGASEFTYGYDAFLPNTYKALTSYKVLQHCRATLFSMKRKTLTLPAAKARACAGARES